jgi:hypothetical protein
MAVWDEGTPRLFCIFHFVSVFVQDLVDILPELIDTRGIDKDMGVIQILNDELTLFVQSKDNLLHGRVTIR